MGLFVVFVVAVDAAMAGLLLQHAWANSWFRWSPPDSALWYTEFRPYVTFYPGLLLAVLSAVTAAGVAADARSRTTPGSSWARPSGWAHVALGAAMSVASLVLLSLVYTCSDPGGCGTEVVPYLPVVVPSLVLIGLGVALVLLDRIGYTGRLRAPRSTGP